MLADPHAERTAGELFELSRIETQTTIALIGPEGGFTDDEHGAALAVGATPVRLGSHILRIETAALAISAAWACRGSQKQKPDSI